MVAAAGDKQQAHRRYSRASSAASTATAATDCFSVNPNASANLIQPVYTGNGYGKDNPSFYDDHLTHL